MPGKERKVVYVNLADKDEMKHYPEGIVRLIAENDWKVVNAPRPVPCEVPWAGKFRHGAFYGAGSEEKFGAAWEALDCWPVVFVTNHDIEEIVRAEAKQDESEKFLTEENIGRVAKALGYPWVEQKARGR
ncbi:MAG: hypothetical protein JRH07_08940 [Deltaproteobacteria bacterium]|nr:hypothetical protein [Deltaproteobacteria bacterium]